MRCGDDDDDVRRMLGEALDIASHLPFHLVYNHNSPPPIYHHILILVSMPNRGPIVLSIDEVDRLLVRWFHSLCLHSVSFGAFSGH